MSTATESGPVRRQDGRIGEALVRLNRAAQRASIYPPGHPAIPAAVRAFIESLSAALAERPVLHVGVAPDRLVVEGVSLDERKPALSWLTEQLRERGIASFEIEQGASEAELVRFVEWLALPLPTVRDGGEVTSFSGIALARIDYGKARFVEAPTARIEDPARLWEALASSLTAGWYLEDRPLPEDPLALAQELSAHVLRNEGVGAAALLARIEATGAHLPHLPDAVRVVIKRRLAAFVAGLSPDLQGQLLRVDKDASRLKVEFLAEIMDDLPDTLVMEVLADIDLGGGPPPRHLLNLFNKLIGVAAKDPFSRELAEAKLQSVGLSAGLAELDPAKIESALREVFDARADYENPEAYQQRLEGLSREGPGSTVRYESRHYLDSRDASEVTAHTSSIVLNLLAAAPDLPEAPDHARRLLAELPRDVAARRFEMVAGRTATLGEILGRPSRVLDEVRVLAADYVARTVEPDFVVALIQAAEQSTGPPQPGVVSLFRASGVLGACAAFDRLAELPEGDAHERISELLFLLETEAFNAAVARLRTSGSPSLRALFTLLRRPGAPLGTDIVLTLLANKDPEIRSAAFHLLLGADTSGAQFPRLLAKALADPDPGIVALGLERASSAGASSARALGEFLRSWLAGGLARELGRKVTSALAAIPGTEGRDILAQALLARKTSLSIAATRRSMVVEAGLIRIGDDEAVAAVRSFRRSPAGWLSMLLPEDPESED
jgi:hypothetical protein